MPLVLRRLTLAERYCLKLLSSKLLSSNNFQIINRIMPHTIHLEAPLTSANDLLIDFVLRLHNKGITIAFMWVPSHKGISGNEIADKTSYKGINALDVKNVVHVPMTDYYYDVNISIKKLLLDFWKEDQKCKGKWYGSIQDKLPRRPWYDELYDPQKNVAQSFVLAKQCSIFTAEAYAVFEAVKAISCVYNCKYFLIITDTLSLLNSLKYVSLHYKTNYIIYFIKDFVLRLHNKGITIAFMWVPSHKGISGNEIADKTSYKGINALDVKNVVYVPMTDYYYDVNISIKKLLLDFWKEDQKCKGKWYGSIQDKLLRRPWYDELDIASREYITTINRLRFGHNTAPCKIQYNKL